MIACRGNDMLGLQFTNVATIAKSQAQHVLALFTTVDFARRVDRNPPVDAVSEPPRTGRPQRPYTNCDTMLPLDERKQVRQFRLHQPPPAEAEPRLRIDQIFQSRPDAVIYGVPFYQRLAHNNRYFRALLVEQCRCLEAALAA